MVLAFWTLTMTIWRSISVVLPLFVAMGLDLSLLAKGDLFDRGETSLLPLLSNFQSAGSGFNMSDPESSGLLVRQQRVCPAGYRTYCIGCPIFVRIQLQ
jgi:hypothetical protein